MVPRDEPSPEKQFVAIDFCNERFNRILDQLTMIDKKVTELSEDLSQEQKESKREWKMFVLSILSGVIVALVTWALSHLR
jgi:hypothetical protein